MAFFMILFLRILGISDLNNKEIPMKKLFCILPIILILLSCNEDPTQVQTDKRFKTVYGFDRTLETGQIAGRLGDVSKNNCIPIEGQYLVSFPNPAFNSITLDFQTLSNRTCVIYIETALADDVFLDQLLSISYPSQFTITQHKEYFKKSFYKGEINAGSNNVILDINQIGTGVYYITYEDSEGYSICSPLIVQK
jgi:hypothetical protein